MPLFRRGYSDLNTRLEKRSRFTMSCFNCDYYYQTKEDEEEVCQNSSVLQYDMVVSENNIYCNQWKNCRYGQEKVEPVEQRPSIKSIFKKRKK